MAKNIIQVSFKDDELELFYRIQMRCKLTGKSGWFKEAALEKLEREDHPQLYVQQPTNVNSSSTSQNSYPSEKLLFDDNGLENMLMMIK